MKKLLSFIGYVTFFIAMITIDFLTKQWALKTLATPLNLNSLVSCELVINRGISWGIFHHATEPFLLWLSIAVSLFIVLLAGYTVLGFIKKRPIYPELLVLAGAVGNLIDRIMYKGVVDFVFIHVGPLNSPVFNIADVLIIVGFISILTSVNE